MDFNDCTKFANETPVCYLATVEGDQPRVRALGFWFADESGFYFQTGAMKDMYGQLRTNPKVEVCFWQPGEAAGAMMRVAGKIEFVDEPELKKKVLEDRPFLKDLGMTFDSPELIIFRISKGEAYFWTMTTNLEPKKFIKFGD
ncbi:pyridoxamine 5'-phosphate oxidase family protein [Methanosarcina sp. T3]|uniref:pyridoxamine 5'-phosphate oxidase family protein n=1 Tax=Methanosarcina sp. T3 TaxID=3439062 RepID=UPI003F828F25